MKQSTLRYFLHQNLRYKYLFFSTGTLWILGMILQKLIFPLIVAKIVDILIKVSTQHSVDYVSVFMPYILLLVVAGFIAQIFIDTGLLMLSKLETKVRPDIQSEAYAHLQARSMLFHANSFSGSLVAQVNRFTAAYVTLTDTFIITVLRLVSSVLIAITIIAFYSPVIALAMLVWTIIFASLNIHLTRRRIHLSKLAAEADSILTAHLADTLSNIATIKSFTHEAIEAQAHDDKSQDRAQKKYRSWVRSVKNDTYLGVLMTILQIGVLVLSVIAIAQNAISIGTLLLIQIYVNQIVSELWGFSGLSRTIEQALSDATEMKKTLSEEIEIKDLAEPSNDQIQNGAIKFDDVSFEHTDSRDHESLFNHFSLTIPSGQKVGLIGKSGSGKTTFTQLIQRFVDIDSGKISIDDIDITHIKQVDLRRNIAYVPQEPLLFHRSIRENIAYGDEHATDEMVKTAAGKAHALEFIEQLPNGFETMVGERGIKLSGGQRQRIAIARAILKSAPILILDEATSALDSESEKLIQESLSDLMKNRTAIVIAHRLSTIQKMDRIIVLDNGSIVEDGTHAALLSKNGIYTKLWSHQSGNFIKE